VQQDGGGADLDGRREVHFQMRSYLKLLYKKKKYKHKKKKER